jgi:hypothetical protein
MPADGNRKTEHEWTPGNVRDFVPRAAAPESNEKESVRLLARARPSKRGFTAFDDNNDPGPSAA